MRGWLGGGVNLVDFTDLANPRELAFWVAGEPDGERSFTDTAHWYNGRISAVNLAVAQMDSPVTRRGFEGSRCTLQAWGRRASNSNGSPRPIATGLA